MEEWGEVERGDDAGGPSRECIGEVITFLNSGFSNVLPKVRIFYTREAADEGFMVPKGSTPPLPGVSILRYISRTLLIKKLTFLADFMKN